MADWPTTRRYPRTIAEAFPGSIEMAAALELPPRSLWRTLNRWVGSIMRG